MRGRAWRAHREAGGGRGQALVETAVVLPFLLLLLLGLMQFGLIFHTYLTLEEAARIGVREWALGQAQTGCEVLADTAAAMPTLTNASSEVVNLSINGAPWPYNPVDAAACANAASPQNTVAIAQSVGTPLAVELAYVMPLVIPPFDGIPGGQVTLDAAVTMEAE